MCLSYLSHAKIRASSKHLSWQTTAEVTGGRQPLACLSLLFSFVFFWLFVEREVEPGSYGDPAATAHSSSAKRTVQDGEFGHHHAVFIMAERIFMEWKK